MEKVILVDKEDREVGTEDKIEAHRSGLLHRAFSVFIFNSEGKLLLQKREKSKYHSAGLWTNTCCSHPRPGEDTLRAAHRRLQEEMGFDSELREIHSFVYRSEFENGLTEYEFDHVFFGQHDKDPLPNPEEVEEWKWVDKKILEKDLKNNPENYTYWLKDCYSNVLEKMKGL